MVTTYFLLLLAGSTRPPVPLLLGEREGMIAERLSELDALPTARVHKIDRIPAGFADPCYS